MLNESQGEGYHELGPSLGSSLILGSKYTRQKLENIWAFLPKFELGSMIIGSACKALAR